MGINSADLKCIMLFDKKIHFRGKTGLQFSKKKRFYVTFYFSLFFIIKMYTIQIDAPQRETANF